VCVYLSIVVTDPSLHRGQPPYTHTIDGCVRYIEDWITVTQPIYLMASTPAGFSYTPTRLGLTLNPPWPSHDIAIANIMWYLLQ